MEYTTRAKLEKAEDGEFADQDVLNRNFDTIDSLLGAQSVTSTTRPAAPFIGQRIWESDTKQERTWNGTTWIWSGGIRPNARLTRRGGLQSGITAAAFTVKLDTVDYNFGGLTAVADTAPVGTVTDHWLQVGEDGWYDVTLGIYLTGGVAPSSVNVYLRKRNNANAFIADYDITSVIKATSLDEKRITNARIDFKKGDRAHLFVTRALGDANTSLYGSPSVFGSTALEMTYSGPL